MKQQCSRVGWHRCGGWEPQFGGTSIHSRSRAPIACGRRTEAKAGEQAADPAGLLYPAPPAAQSLPIFGRRLNIHIEHGSGQCHIACIGAESGKQRRAVWVYRHQTPPNHAHQPLQQGTLRRNEKKYNIHLT